MQLTELERETIERALIHYAQRLDSVNTREYTAEAFTNLQESRKITAELLQREWTNPESDMRKAFRAQYNYADEAERKDRAEYLRLKSKYAPSEP